jgi:alpha-mannosidase
MAGYTFHLIPHTHWDREWYLSDSTFLARLVPALDDLLVRLGSDPDLTFLLDGQTVLLEDYLRVRPDRETYLAELVRSGRLQVGPWYILADELIPSGESLVRNLLAGQADATRFGARTDVLYSPDAFGHPALWPQLAGEFGIRFGVVWRGLGGEVGQERDLYRWRGPDGREVLLYHLPPDGYEVGAALPADPERLPRVWARLRPVLVDRAATRHVPIFIGADHHAVHPAVPGLQALLTQLEPGSEFRISRLQDFFIAAAAEAAGVAVLAGELRWSYGYTWTLQGVHGTRSPLKRRHARTELLLAGHADPLAGLAWALRGSDRRALLQHAWRLLLQCQFHDSIGGCTSDAVATRVELRLDDARNVAEEIARTSLDTLIGNDPDRVRANPDLAEPQLVLWNPVPRRRSGVVVADLTWFRRDVLIGPPGERMPRMGPGVRPFHLLWGSESVGVQSLGRRQGQERLDAPHHYPDQDEVDWTRVALRTPELNGMGLMSLQVGDGWRAGAAATWCSGRTIGNELVEVTIERQGTLELMDRRTGQRYQHLLSLECQSDIGDTYTYAAPQGERPQRHRGPVAVTPLAAGPLVAALELRWSFKAGRRGSDSGRGVVHVRCVVSLYAGSSAVRCSLEIDNRAFDHRLRARVPAKLRGARTRVGGQLGVAERTVAAAGRTYPRETPVATAPAHRYVAQGSKNRGLAVLAPGFFEYELDPGGDLLITILRAVGQLSRPDLSTRPGHAGWPMATPLAQCQGMERVELALAPLSGAQLERDAVLAQLWEDIFLPIQPVWLRQGSPLSIPSIDIRLEGEGLIFSAIKPAERGTGVVLRCYNVTAEPRAGTWHLSEVVSGASRARADEHLLHEIRLGEAGRSIPFHAAPHEIVTIMVTLAGPH